MLSAEMYHWLRVMAYGYLAVMLSVTGSFAPRLKIALYLTSGSFIISSVGAFFLICGREDWRDMMLNIQSVYLTVVTFAWILSIRRITKALK